MAFPTEFNFLNEDDFTRNFIIPLIRRLGYSLVFHFHGAREFGKDLIFADVDPFGHIRYYGLQAKYEASISLNGVESVVHDCLQAFANPFTHPQTGSVERICGFYALNGGSLGDAAVTHYFNSLRPRFGGNVYLLQGRDLELLNRWAATSRSSFITEQLTGILLEIRYNRIVLTEVTEQFNKNTISFLRLKIDSISNYLTTPTLGPLLDNSKLLKYWRFTTTCNEILRQIGTPLFNSSEGRIVIINEFLPVIHQLSETIEKSAINILASLSPLSFKRYE